MSRRHRIRPPLRFRLLMSVLIFVLSWAIAGLSALLFWVLLTRWPGDYDNIPLVVWAVAWAEQSFLATTMRRDAEKEGLL